MRPKKFTLFLLFLSFISLGPSSAGANPVNLATTKVKSLEGKLVSLKDHFKGEVLILDFWASWCEPCKESLPFYETLQKRYASQGLKIVALSVDDDLKSAKDFVSQNKLSLTFLWDEKSALAKSLGLRAIPSTLILDKNGKVLYQERGFLEASKKNFETQVQNALKKNK